jgi:hypothetical protein
MALLVFPKGKTKGQRQQPLVFTFSLLQQQENQRPFGSRAIPKGLALLQGSRKTKTKGAGSYQREKLINGKGRQNRSGGKMVIS